MNITNNTITITNLFYPVCVPVQSYLYEPIKKADELDFVDGQHTIIAIHSVRRRHR